MMPTPGVCTHCKVTDEQVDGNKRSWHNVERTCCSKYSCVKAYLNAARRRARQPKPRSRFQELIARGFGYGAARLEVQREERQTRRRRGKGKAA